MICSKCNQESISLAMDPKTKRLVCPICSKIKQPTMQIYFDRAMQSNYKNRGMNHVNSKH